VKHHSRIATRIAELRAIIAAYAEMTVEAAEQSDAGDQEIEARAELWRLEQELADHHDSHRYRAA
jgi:hypothetical protein